MICSLAVCDCVYVEYLTRRPNARCTVHAVDYVPTNQPTNHTSQAYQASSAEAGKAEEEKAEAENAEALQIFHRFKCLTAAADAVSRISICTTGRPVFALRSSGPPALCADDQTA